tara:strand:- start:476 stop:622 length:147 start_codon:yes stop_codon:yes gene_type:complete
MEPSPYKGVKDHFDKDQYSLVSSSNNEEVLKKINQALNDLKVIININK